MYILNEDAFDDIPDVKEIDDIEANELTPEPPEVGEDMGIANLLHDLLIDEHEAVQGYNTAIANCESREELIPIFKDILAEEMNHIGMLEVALELISPNAEGVEEGEEEASELLDNPAPDEEKDDVEEDDIEEVDEALHISDDMTTLRTIDKAIKSCPSAEKLSDAEKEEIANYVNELLHQVSEKKK